MPTQSPPRGSAIRRLIGVSAAGALVAGVLAAAPAAQAAPVEIGDRTFEVTSAVVGQNDLYQAAYSERNDALWVSGTTHHWDNGSPMAATSTIKKLDPDTLAVQATITPRTLSAGTANVRPEAAYGIAVDDENNRLWTSATREDAVVVYDQATGARVTTISGVGHSRDIAIDPFRDVAYVSDPNGGQIIKISTSTFAILDRIDGSYVANAPWSGYAISPMSLDLVATATSSKLYSVNLNDGRIVAVDSVARSVRIVGDSEGSRASGIAVDAARNLAYVSSQDSSDVRTVNLATGAVKARAATSAGTLNSAVDAEEGLVYSSVFYGEDIAVTDADTGALVGEIPVGAAPNDVIVAGGSAYAVDRAVPSKVWKITPDGEGSGPTDPTDPTDPEPGVAAVTVEGTPKIGGTVTLKGTNWFTRDNTGSTIAVKLDRGTFKRADNASDTWQVIQAGADGKFEATFQVPDGTTAGAKGSTPAYPTGPHVLNLLSGSLGTNDNVRSIPVNLEVGAATPVDPEPVVAAVTVEGTPKIGGTVTLKGTNWLTRDNTGSTIGIKLDRGTFKRADNGSDVWQIIQAEADGSFEATFQVPDGTTAGAKGSTPAYPTGPHVLNLLSGSLGTNDNVRSIPVDLEVGAAGPTDPTDPTDPEPVVPKPKVTKAPKLTGDPRFGQTLRILPGVWTNADSFTYQWMRNGSAIRGATGTTYRPVAADVDRHIWVRVSATGRGGTATADAPSLQVRKARAKVGFAAGKTQVKVGQRARVRVVVTAPRATGKVRILVNGKQVAVRRLSGTERRGVVTVRLPKRPAGALRVRAVFSGNNVVAKTGTRSTVRVVRR